MKSFLFALTLSAVTAFTTLSHAELPAGAFDRTSVVPIDLQDVILRQIESQCKRKFVSLAEVSTSIEVRKVDPDIVESATYVEYTSEFEAVFVQGDRQSIGRILVKSYARNLSDPFAAHYSADPIDTKSTSGACY